MADARPTRFLLQGDGGSAHTLVHVGILLREAVGDRGHFLSGALDRNARLEATDDPEVPGPRLFVRKRRRTRGASRASAPRDSAKPVGRHANDGVRLAVQEHALTDHCRAAAETLASRSDRRAPPPSSSPVSFSSLGEGAAQDRPHRRAGRRSSSSPRALDPHGISAAGHRHASRRRWRPGTRSLRLGRDVEEVLRRVDAGERPFQVWASWTRRSGSSKGSGRRSTALMTLKIALLAPMPRASVAIAMRVNTGDCHSRRRA